MQFEDRMAPPGSHRVGEDLAGPQQPDQQGAQRNAPDVWPQDLLKEGGCLFGRERDRRDRLLASTHRQDPLARRAQVSHPVDLSIGSLHPPAPTVFYYGYLRVPELSRCTHTATD